MSLTNPKTAISEQDLKDFYDKIKPFLAPKTYAGFTPIGTIISIFGESAPANYLICDGATYNVVDYPELCAHLWSLPTNSQYKVSGDATKFKVPDLRGEFLRGTGTNSHADSGNGADVGVHQAPTQIPNYTSTNGEDVLIFPLHTTGADSTKPKVLNQDTVTSTSNVFKNLTPTGTQSGAIPTRFTSRPTNTSVLFCIATKNIYLDPKNDYSTEEKVIGTWIDGSTIYQKTINFGTLPNATSKAVAHGISNLSTVVNLTITAKNNSGGFLILPYSYSSGSTENYVIFGCDSTNITIVANTDRSAFSGTATIQYTKTTT